MRENTLYIEPATASGEPNYTTPEELGHLVYARQLDEPGFGEVPREEMT